MALTAEERETIVTMDDSSEKAFIYTAQRAIITKLKRNPAAELVTEGSFEGTAWAKFRLPSKLVSLRKPMKLSDEERARRGNTLVSWREDPEEGLDIVVPDA